jgi:hypothetical protein
VTFLNTVVNSQCFYVEYLIGLRVKTALISAVYKKSTKLSNTGRKEMTGKVNKSITFLPIHKPSNVSKKRLLK